MAPDAAQSLTRLLRELREADRDFDVDSLLTVVRYLERPADFPEPGAPLLTITCTAEGLFRVQHTLPNGHWYTIEFGAGAPHENCLPSSSEPAGSGDWPA